MEHDDLFGIGENDEYRYVRFGLFAAEDIIAADGTSIPADGMIAEVSLGEDMTAKFDAQLPFGRYYVQEIATDEHYICIPSCHKQLEASCQKQTQHSKN